MATVEETVKALEAFRADRIKNINAQIEKYERLGLVVEQLHASITPAGELHLDNVKTKALLSFIETLIATMKQGDDVFNEMIESQMEEFKTKQ